MALIDNSFLAGFKSRRRQIKQTSACIYLLSAGRARLFAFENSITGLDHTGLVVVGRHPYPGSYFALCALSGRPAALLPPRELLEALLGPSS